MPSSFSNSECPVECNTRTLSCRNRKRNADSNAECVVGELLIAVIIQYSFIIDEDIERIRVSVSDSHRVCAMLSVKYFCFISIIGDIVSEFIIIIKESITKYVCVISCYIHSTVWHPSAIY